MHCDLSGSRDFADAIVQSVPDPLVVLDSTLRIKFVNRASCHTFKLSAVNKRELGLFTTLNDSHWKFKRLRSLVKELLSQNSSTPHLEVNSYFTGKAHKTMLLNARRIPAHGASKAMILLTLQDISARKQVQHTLEKLIDSFKQDSLTDALTGLYNRRGFLTLGAQFLKIGRRMGKEIFVLFADVDSLKAINDQRGHAEGDKVLVKVSDILKKTFRQSDIISRIGGDEFAIVTIEHLLSLGSIATVVTRLKHRNSVQANGDTPVSFSVGFAHSPAHGYFHH